MSAIAYVLPLIDAGTISVTNGNALVNLNASGGSAWVSASTVNGAALNRPRVMAGTLIAAGAEYTIESQSLDNQIVLARPYAGTTNATLAYKIRPVILSDAALISGSLDRAVLRYASQLPEISAHFQDGTARGRAAIEGNDLVFRVGSGAFGSNTDVLRLSPSGVNAGANQIWHAGTFGRPQAAAGVGQVVTITPVANVALVLPASGTWHWFAILGSTAGNMVNGTFYNGIAAGGTTVLAAPGAGNQWNATAWRIA